MSTLQTVLIVLLAAMVLYLWRMRRVRDVSDTEDADRIDTLIGWPPHATRVLSTQERIALGTLRRALPEFMVLAQVPLSRFVSVPKRNSYAEWLRRVGYQCADFVICDAVAQVVAVVEVQPPTSLSGRALKRSNRMARTLAASNLPLYTWIENEFPSVDEARQMLLPKPKPVEAAPTAAAPAAAAAAAGAAVPAAQAEAPARYPNAFDDTAPDPVHEQWNDLLEPPPSTWFDELESSATPLGRR